MSTIPMTNETDQSMMDDMDKDLESCMKAVVHVRDLSTRTELESKLLNMRLKREKIRRFIFLSRSQSIIAEIEQRLAQNELVKELCEYRSLFKKLRHTEDESRESKKVKLSKEEEGSVTEERCRRCKSRLAHKDSKSKEKSNSKSKSSKGQPGKNSDAKQKQTSQTIKHNDKCKHNKNAEINSRTLPSKRLTYEEPTISSPCYENNTKSNGEDKNEDKNGEDVTTIEQQNTTNRLFEELLSAKNIRPIQIDIDSMSTETVKIQCPCEDANCFNYSLVSP